MRFALITVIVTTLLLAASPRASAADFGLIDQHGQFHHLYRYRNVETVAVLTFSYQDAESLAVARQFADACDQAESSQLACLLLNATDSANEIRNQTESPGNLPVLIDGSQTVAGTLGFTRLGELVTLDPASVDFKDAAIAGFEAPEQGTAIDFHFLAALDERGISYQDDIAPLLQRRCAYCHIEDGLAPWAMNRHIMVMGWSPMMREVLITRRMPPGQIDNAVGNWQQTHELSDAEMALLIAWIDRGAPNDGSEDPLLVPPAPMEDWPLGEPDLIVDVPEQQIPATGNVDFLVEKVALDLPADRWLRAISYKVGDRSVLHSLLVYAVEDSVTEADPDALISRENAQYISVYVPGEHSDQFGDDTGFLLSADRDMAFKLRYLTSGRETVDRSQIGLYFHDEAPARQLRTIMLEKPELNIPANAANHIETLRSEPLAQDARLESYSPHAHSRGKSMNLTATYPDGRQESLINVANFNYNWQLDYKAATEKLLPAGTVLTAETVYDNSSSNPFNADPDQALDASYSDQSEMFVHFVRISESLRDAARTP